MTSTVKFIIAGGISCLVLGGTLLALTLSEQKEETPNEETATRLQYEKDPALLKSLTVSHKSGEYTLTKSDAGFHLEGMEDLPLNDTVLEDLTEAASKVTTQKSIAENTEDLSAFGLDSPALRVKAEFSDSKNTVKEFLLGNSLLDTSLSYFSFAGENAIYAVRASAFSVFYQLPEELLSLTLFPNEEDTIFPQTLTLKKSGWNEPLVLSGTVTEKDDTKYLEWEVSSPKNTGLAASDYTLNLWGLTADEVSAVYPSDELLSLYKITDPEWTVTLSGNGKSYTLNFSPEENGTAYVLLEGVPILYKISTSRLPWQNLLDFSMNPAESD